MKKVVVTGRVIPERALVQFPTVAFGFETGGGKGQGKVCCQMSLVSCVLEFDSELNNIFVISSIAREVVSGFSNLISFHIAGAYHIALDLIVDLETGQNHPIPTREPVFPSAREDFKFMPIEDHAPVNLDTRHLSNLALKEALSEVSLALQRPHLTQMHCRRAIEALRWHFEDASEQDDKKRESVAWQKLRETLEIERSDIETFREPALHQRHGRATHNTWDERKNALAITFEIVHRFMQHLLK